MWIRILIFAYFLCKGFNALRKLFAGKTSRRWETFSVRAPEKFPRPPPALPQHRHYLAAERDRESQAVILAYSAPSTWWLRYGWWDHILQGGIRNKLCVHVLTVCNSSSVLALARTNSLHDQVNVAWIWTRGLLTLCHKPIKTVQGTSSRLQGGLGSALLGLLVPTLSVLIAYYRLFTLFIPRDFHDFRPYAVPQLD